MIIYSSTLVLSLIADIKCIWTGQKHVRTSIVSGVREVYTCKMDKADRRAYLVLMMYAIWQG